MKALRIALTALMLVFGLALLGGTVPIARAGTLIVDNTIACDDVSGSPAYCTIQAAINAASHGDTISVNPGTYDETLSITKPITLSGADKTNTIITYTGTAVEQQVFLGTNVGLNLDGPVTIENFTLYNGGSLVGDNDLIKFRARGVGGQITIRDNIFDCDGDGSVTTAKGIEEAYQASNFVITGNEFHACSYSIWLNGARNGEISNNMFYASPVPIGMGGSGAGDLAPHSLSVSGNVIGNGTYGLVLARNIYDISFTCNRITNSSFAAILFWEHGPEDWSGVVFNYNNIAGNAAGMRGFSDPGATPILEVDATENWWGAADGPSGNGPGNGDSVLLNNVNFDPWLMEEIGDVCPPPTDNEGPITSNVVADPNPAPVNTAIVLTANVDDSTTGGSNIASAEYSLDGGAPTSMAASDSAFDEVSEEVTDSFTAPTTPGVYSLCVRGTDAAGNTSSGEDCIMLVVYDPDGGFVTGGGWIWSPAGAYAADQDLEGKATFGFVSKYKKGADTPTGNTEFVFHAGGLNFHSSSYDWLVVNQGGTNAQFKGMGTINGEGNYKFMLWAGDDDPDTFRIKIWEEVDGVETVVYDNGFDQAIGGGSIVVHKK